MPPAAGGLNGSIDAAAPGPAFDRPVPRDGYAWWYVDGMSDDGHHGITLIAFVGSVFSPYYAWARRKGPAEAENFCAVNVALYTPGKGRWALTERGSGALERSATHLRVGPSGLHWDGQTLEIEINEWSSPLPRRVRGRIRVKPHALQARAHALDTRALHHWHPLAPCSRVEVSFTEPGLRWSGEGYLDMNWGDEPLERGFTAWDWSRAPLRDGRTAVLYDRAERAAADQRKTLALLLDPQGGLETFEPPPRTRLATTPVWRVPRTVQRDPDSDGRVVRTLEDTPFYSRSMIRSRLLGEDVQAMHESLLLTRFEQTWVQALLPFRMPRITRWP